MVQNLVNKSARSQAQRPLRSQPNRDRILAAARHVFAIHGYDRATIRLVAAEARTAPSMVIRYFGSKDGLFAVAVQFELRLPDLTRLPKDDLGAHLTRHFLTRWEQAPSGGELGALLRAAVSSEEARQRLIEIFQGQLQVAVAAISSPEDADRRAALIASQFLGLALTRYVLALPACVAMEHEVIIANVGATVQAYLTRGLSVRGD
ncbi:TetR family transcriptional regulator [Mesorhizobium qingshengii]|uniref:TetR/AcrR family transcriptional regulator n=1 Tax=Mesorhizobium qingshengii TaxID=1165689 RepID=UPI001ABF1EAF|nr:TetR family transcriptional regulator [Mesorhizobium qingshengii]